ncbi:MAG: hypothetical protein LBH43_20505 [Treponema sp.]|jgi:hypothetical protein|nr:hypothetical protein [Treponema sp.]
MEEMTAEQAAEWGKTLNFEKVWAMFAEIGRKQAKTDEQIKELSANIGGVNNTLGKWSEEMFAVKLCDKVNLLGYEFTKCGRNMRFWENGKRIAEVDCFLENGDFVMPVEVKANVTTGDVDKHIKRIEKMRGYMDTRNDLRTIVGAVAGAIVSGEVCEYAQYNGLYVLVQSGESIAVADMPEGFEARKWDGVRTNGT